MPRRTWTNHCSPDMLVEIRSYMLYISFENLNVTDILGLKNSEILFICKNDETYLLSINVGLHTLPLESTKIDPANVISIYTNKPSSSAT